MSGAEGASSDGSFLRASYRDPVFAALVEFVAGERFQEMFETYFLAHALEFTDDDEMPLRYYELYQEFQTMFEGSIDEFCRQQGLSQREFFCVCQQAQEEDEAAKTYLTILLASVEFKTFVDLMRMMRPVAREKGIKHKPKNSTSGSGDAKGQCEYKHGPNSGGRQDKDVDDEPEAQELQEFVADPK